MIKISVLIELDSREPSEFLHHLKSVFDKKDVKTRKNLFKTEIKALKVGDFIINNTIGIERKAARDFISSISDKRLFRQIEDLVKAYGHQNSYLLLEGSLEKEMQWSKISPESVYGALRWVGQQCHVINVLNTQQSARFLINLAKQIMKDDTPRLPRMVINKPRENETDIKRWQIAFLQTLPKIGATVSTSILNEYGCPKAFFDDITDGKIPKSRINNKEEAIKIWKSILTEVVEEKL
nr:MAG: ERCC4 domain nuclease [Lokiarchaeota virus Ratatoskr Meg22_1012]